MRTLIMKFGGASVATPLHFSRIADIVLQRKKDYERIVTVVSAMGNTTDQLISLAKQVNPNPPRREYDMLVTVGERISISLLAMALSLKNQEAVSFTGSQSGIITTNDHTEARIIDVRPFRLQQCLENGQVVIVAGFQGVSLNKEITTLGRGGSDTTAVALGVALEAECVEFYKDVSGIYEKDPKEHPGCRSYPSLTFDEAREIVEQGAKVLSARCIDLAQKNGLPLWVRSFLSDSEEMGTRICDHQQSNRAEPIYECSTVVSNPQ